MLVTLGTISSANKTIGYRNFCNAKSLECNENAFYMSHFAISALLILLSMSIQYGTNLSKIGTYSCRKQVSNTF